VEGAYSSLVAAATVCALYSTHGWWWLFRSFSAVIFTEEDVRQMMNGRERSPRARNAAILSVSTSFHPFREHNFTRDTQLQYYYSTLARDLQDGTVLAIRL